MLLAEHDPDQPTPYRGRRELAEEVAGALAHRAGRSFLIARIVARSLVSDDQPLDTTRRGWDLQLPATVGHAFDGYLERFGPGEQRARDLLAPLAFAEGAGLPEHLWVPATRALSGNDGYTDHDVRWIQETAAAYLIEAREHGRSAYRLYHEALAEHLRAQHPGPELQRRITQLLRALLPAAASGQPAWEAAEPYVRAHLASHAAAAEQLDDLLIDPGFLLAADPDRLLRALPAANRPDGQEAADVYRSALYQLRGRPLPEAAAYLQLAARQYGADDLAERVGHLEHALPWSVPWANYTRAHPHLTLGAHLGGVYAIVVAELDGRPIAITGGDSIVRVWDLAGGTQLHQLTGHTGGVHAIRVAELNGCPIAITRGGGIEDDGTIRVWDLARGTQLHQLSGHTGWVSGITVAELDSCPIAITDCSDGTVRVWDLTRGTQLVLIALAASVKVVSVGPQDLLVVRTPMGLVAFRLNR
jgi:hypothetical protein